MREVILHIGAHKTGSSAIQSALKEYDDGLTRYARLNGENHSIPMYTIFSSRRCEYHVWRNLGYTEDAIKQYAHSSKRRLVSELKRADRERLIVSGEDISNLSHAEKQELIAFLAREGLSVKVVCYFRSPLSYAVSKFQQDVKAGVSAISPIRPAYEARISPFLSATSSSQVIVREYSRETLKDGDVVSDFCDIIEVPAPPPRSTSVNKGLSSAAARLVFLFNRTDCRSFGTRAHLQARSRLVALLAHVFSKYPPMDQNLFASLVEVSSSEIDFLRGKFGIEFSLSGRPYRVDLERYLADLSEIDLSDLDRCLKGIGAPHKANDSIECKLISMYRKLLCDARSVRC